MKLSLGLRVKTVAKWRIFAPTKGIQLKKNFLSHWWLLKTILGVCWQNFNLVPVDNTATPMFISCHPCSSILFLLTVLPNAVSFLVHLSCLSSPKVHSQLGSFLFSLNPPECLGRFQFCLLSFLTLPT